VTSQGRHPGSGRAALPARAGHRGLRAEVVPSREHREGDFQVPQFLEKAQRQPIEPLEESPLRAVETFYVTGGYRPLVPLAYAPHASLARSDPFGGRIDHVRVPDSGHGLQHRAVKVPKARANFVKETQRCINRGNCLAQDAALAQSVVPTGTGDPVGGVRRNVLELVGDILGNMAVNSQRRSVPATWESLAARSPAGGPERTGRYRRSSRPVEQHAP